MDYEKVYKEALDRASKVKLRNPVKRIQDEIDSIFPELKESEDEKIRKEIISIVKSYRESCITEGNHRFDDCISWLEKQGEKEEINETSYRIGIKRVLDNPESYGLEKQANIPHFTYDDILALQCAMKTAEKADNELYEQLERLHDRLHDVYWLEKKGEQKPTDKVEPKFKVGDYVVGKYISGYISEVSDDCYLLDYQGFSIDKQDDYHLWTIQDAKDGDVLMANAPFIFNGNLEGGIGCPGAHCGINTSGNFQIPNYPTHWTGHNTYPATKEQRDLLFQKMKEAGYEWDAEKKELKKISQEYPLTPSECFNPSWSEEDEKFIHGLIRGLKAKRDIYGHTTFSSDCIDITETIDWLKSLKDRVQPQQQGWSEEDELMLNRCISDFEYLINHDKASFIGRYKEQVEWLKNHLKFLKPNNWKPSGEQMQALLYALGKGGTYNKEALTRLYNDLENFES